MGLHLHRAPRIEDLAAALARNLSKTWPDDPFEAVAVGVGNRGMRRWLQHDLATRLGVATRIDYPSLRQVLDGAAARLLGAPREPGGAFWSAEVGASMSEGLAFRVVQLLRALVDDRAFAPVKAYLYPEDVPHAVDRRELAFATEVAAVLDALVRDRPEAALRWAEDPASAPFEHAWLAHLLHRLDAAAEDAPARLHARLVGGEALVAPLDWQPLHLFGTSSLGPGDRARLAAIGRVAPVHLYLCLPEDGAPALLGGSTGAQAALLTAWASEAGATIHVEGPAAPGLDPANLEIYATYGPLRQVEILRDRLLTLFAEDPNLEPRDVLVMTPDVETFAPLIAAVFAQRPIRPPAPVATDRDDVAPRWARPPAVPVAISDLGLARTNPVAEALLAVLALVGERVAAPALFDLFSLEPVRARFGIDGDSLDDIRTLLDTSGMRWGVDAADRASFGQPALDQNTLRFGLERLALGALMPDTDALGVVTGVDPSLPPVAPVDIQSRERVARIGQIASVVRALGHWRRTLGGAGPSIDAWRGELGHLLDAFTETSSAARWLRMEVDGALDNVFAGADVLGGLPVEARSVAALLRGHFEIDQAGDRVVGSAVVVTGLQPMRAAPFRVVALVGMDDASFPRGGTRPRWDPFATPAPGELDPRVVDRHLLTETLLSTRERLLVFFTGRDVKTGGKVPAAVPVEELVDAVRAATGRAREDVVRTPPLQPWSPRAFGASGCPTSFDPLMAEGARLVTEVVERGPAGLAASRDQELPEEDQPPTTLTLTALADGLTRPQKMLLSDRLGLYAERDAAVLEDREPLELDSLDDWALRNRVLGVFLRDPSAKDDAEDDADGEGTTLARLHARLAAEGRLPLKAGGERILAGAVAEARSILDVWGAPPAGTTTLSVEVGGLLLSGRPPTDVDALGAPSFGWVTASRPDKGPPLLGAYVHLLAAVAQGGIAVREARVVGCLKGKGEPVRLKVALTQDEARARLGELVAVWRRARRRPVPLFEKTSWTIATSLDADGEVADIFKLREAVAKAWLGDDHAPGGDASDRWVRPLFADFHPVRALDEEGDGTLLDLARRVWHPVGEAMRAAGSTAAADDAGEEE